MASKVIESIYAPGVKFRMSCDLCRATWDTELSDLRKELSPLQYPQEYWHFKCPDGCDWYRNYHAGQLDEARSKKPKTKK